MRLEQQRHNIHDDAWEKIKRTPLKKRAHVEETQKIQGNLLMGHFGFCAQESHRKTFQQNMDTGKIFIADFADGEIKEFRKIF